MTEEKNEFEDLSEEDFAPKATNSDVPSDGEDMIAHGSGGTEYDVTNAPDTVKAPPRIDMNGKEVTIEKISVTMPSATRPWITSRSGTTKYKYCIFRLFYDNGQQENVSGLRTFPRDVNGVEKYSDPSITRDGVNQASELLKLYSEHKGKDINEVSLREFYAYLNSKPKVLIKGVEVTNPTSGEKITKNLVAKFI